MPKSRKRQSRLAFTPLPSSSPASKGYNKQIRDRAATMSLEGRPSPSKRRRVQDEDEVQVIPSDDEEAATMPTPATSLEKTKDGSEEDSDDQPIRSTQRRSTAKLPTRKSRSKQQRIDFSSARDPDSFDTPVKLASSSPRRTQSSKAGIFSSQAHGKVLDVSSDESDSDSDELPSPRKLMTRSTTAAKEKERQEEQRGVGRPKSLDAEDDESDEITVSSKRPQPQQVEESEDDEDQMPTTLGTQRRKQRRASSRDSFISDSPPAPVESDDDLEIIERPSRKRRRQASDSEEDEEEDAEPKTPSRRRLKKQPRQMSKQEQDDLAEDMDFLGPSSDAENSGPRSSQARAKDARKQALDRLKQKRSGKLPQVEEENEEEEEDGDQNGDDDDDDEVQEISDDEVEEVPQYTSSRQFFKEDEDDADFLVEGDDEEPLGLPDGVPIEFTRYASMKAKDLFKHAVDWMVQRKINPGFQSGDALYKLAFQKLNHEVVGLAGSKFTSSAWTPAFTIALQSRPEIAYEPIDRSSAEHFMRDKCDACNRSGHPATFQIQFQGLPYDSDTMEELTQDNDDSSSDDDDSSTISDKHDDDAPDWDKEGREIVPINTTFYVGKFCKSNAETAHALQHWKHSLMTYVDAFLIKQGYTKAEELAKRDTWSTKKKRKYANKIVDRMNKDGEMKVLWGRWKQNIEEAREAKQGRYDAGSP